MGALQGFGTAASRRTTVLATMALAAMLAVVAMTGRETRVAGPADEGAKSAYGKLALSFVPNAGQTDRRVRYLAQAGGRSFFFTKSKAVFALSGKERSAALELRFRGANPSPALVAERRQRGSVNYLTGGRRHTGLHTYGQVTYRDLWPGIDLTFKGAAEQLKYEFLVHPGARVSDIGLAYAGASGLSLTDQGAMRIGTPLGPLTDSAPRSYQVVDGRRVPVSSQFDLAGTTAYGFETGRYDPNRPLVIDPGLAYSTYLGGSGDDGGTGTMGVDIAVDGQGYAYVFGETGSSTDFPVTPGAYDPITGGYTMFVTKLDRSGSSLVYSTYLGGDNDDEGRSIAVDESGNAYLAGYTRAPDFPVTAGAYDTALNGYDDGFITKLNPTGSDLVYSTFVGGSGFDEIASVAIDGAGNAYVTGSTTSKLDYPVTVGAFDITHGDYDEAFVTKVNASGSSLVYSSFLGGSDGDYEAGRAIAVDPSGSAYVTGNSDASDFPTTPGAYDSTPNGYDDVFVTKVNPSGSALEYSNLLGGSDAAFGWGIAVDGSGSAYVTGREFGGFPVTPGAYNSASTIGNAFVTKLNPSGSNLAYSAALGGSGFDYGLDIDVDSEGSAYIVGQTRSADFPTTPDALDTTLNGTFDNFFSKLSPSGSSLDYSTLLGGSASEGFEARLSVGGDGGVYLAGQTQSTDFPTTPGAFDTTYNGNTDVYVTEFAFTPPYAVPATAHQLSVSLVPVFKQCGTGGNAVNAAHSPPLAVGSCNPPRPAGVARIGPGSTMSATLTAVPGDHIVANGDQADTTLNVAMSDILTDTGMDYVPNPIGPDMTLYARMRFTDVDSGASGSDPGTTSDFDFALPLECATTPSAAVGASCSANTSADAVTPGLIKEGRSTVLQIFRLRVNDSGVDGVRGDADDRIFAQQGFLAP